MASSPQGDDSLTVKGFFNRLTDQYTQEVLRGNLPSTESGLTALVRRLIAEFERLWERLGTVGAFSANDELEDCSTTALEMLWTPYIIGDLYQRAQTGAPSASTSADGATAQVSVPGGITLDDKTAATAALDAARMAAREQSLTGLSRQECLARSHEWFKTFFTWMEGLSLATDKDVETYAVFRAEQRSKRIELARLRADLEQKWRDAESKVGYLRARRRRMQELMAESGDALEEGGGEEEEVLRTRALARLRWSFYDACHQMQLSARELAMLESVNPEQRGRISADYQRTLDAVRRGEMSLGRNTYTILPGGMMVAGTADNPQALDAGVVQRGGGLSSQALSAMASQQAFRQQVRDELQIDRNQPTMSLEAFAQKEMAEVQRQMAEGQRMAQEQAEEDARLGAEGVEDRQRKKDAAWSDWKDEHPAYGQTNKGNYS